MYQHQENPLTNKWKVLLFDFFLPFQIFIPHIGPLTSYLCSYFSIPLFYNLIGTLSFSLRNRIIFHFEEFLTISKIFLRYC